VTIFIRFQFSDQVFSSTRRKEALSFSCLLTPSKNTESKKGNGNFRCSSVLIFDLMDCLTLVHYCICKILEQAWEKVKKPFRWEALPQFPWRSPADQAKDFESSPSKPQSKTSKASIKTVEKAMEIKSRKVSIFPTWLTAAQPAATSSEVDELNMFYAEADPLIPKVCLSFYNA
jgi:hypothetical protein